MIVTEMDRKLNFEFESKSFSSSPQLPIKLKKGLFKNTNKGSSLKIPQGEGNLKRVTSNISKQVNMLNSSISSQQEEYFPAENDQDKPVGVLGYMINKVGNKNDNLSKQVLLDNRLSKMFDDKIHSSHKVFNDRVKRQKFMIINALLKKFHMAYQKRIEYKILFTYIKNIISTLHDNLKKFK
uniref:Uncharacterized protein n=1 Tax=Euplotes harpa TaxID=151035 RepID=A0A7S3JF07_9SPIT|mmetsp:Transcript_3312/g.4089  ORF Transcript_3312/g.4089 Transcript_3312/m.4089 type:complete len:182 (+) Transcript_3312:204-749(+)